MKATVVKVQPLKPRIRVIEATGTPVSESPATAFTALQVLNPGLVPNVKRFGKYFEVRRKMAIPGDKGRKLHFTKVTGYRNLDYLANLLGRHTIRRLKTEVKGMPAVSYSTREVTTGAPFWNSYDKLRRAITDELKSERAKLTLDNAMVRSMRLRQLLEYPPILGYDNLDGPKFLELDMLIEEVLSNPMAKVLVWCNFVGTVQALVERYKGYGSWGLYDATTPDEVAHMGHAFDTDSTRVVIATPKKGGTGIDFLSRARTSIYLSRTYSYIDHVQSINRVVRRTSDNPRDEIERIKASPAGIIFLHVPGTVDDLVEFALNRKTALATAASPTSEIIDIDPKELALLL